MTTTTVAAAPSAAVFDNDLISRLRAVMDDPNANLSAEAVAEAAKEAPTTRAPNADEKMFSEVFWNPVTVPDFPVRVFKDEDWPETVRARIPNEIPNWRWPKEQTEMFAFAMFCNDRTLLHGPTGTGKSALPKAYCAKLRIPYILVSCHGQQEATDFLGKDNIKFDEAKQALSLHVELAALGVGCRDGGMIVLDEAFRSPILMAIQSLLEPGGSLSLPDAAGLSVAERKLTPPDGRSWIVMTDNTNGQGSEDGKYHADVQDLSTLDRITCTIFMDYPLPSEEASILFKVAPRLSKDTIKLIAKVNGKIRDAFKKGTIQQPLSLRASVVLTEKAQYLGMDKAFGMAYASKLGTSDAVVFREIWKQATATEFKG